VLLCRNFADKDKPPEMSIANNHEEVRKSKVLLCHHCVDKDDNHEEVKSN